MATNPMYYAGAVKSSTRYKGVEVLNYLATRGIRLSYVWGYDPSPSNTEHHSGYSLDFMVFKNKAWGDAIYNYLWANRVRLGVKHIIWYQSITSTVTSPGVRRPMANRGNDTQNHKDHVHVMFKPTAYIAPRTSTAPSRGESRGGKYLTENGVMNTGTVRALQKWVGATVDGDFGPETMKALQRRLGFGARSVNGQYSPVLARALQRKVSAPVTSVWNYRWDTKRDNTTLHLQKYLNRGIRAGTLKL